VSSHFLAFEVNLVSLFWLRPVRLTPLGRRADLSRLGFAFVNNPLGLAFTALDALWLHQPNFT
jgi:hypothetical protein